MSHKRLMRRRQALAQAVARATVVERPLTCRGPLYLVHPTITAACEEPLRRIDKPLRDETHSIDDVILDVLKAFISDGQSPFFGRDIGEARCVAVLLQHLVETGHATFPARRKVEPRRRNRRTSCRPRLVTLVHTCTP